MNEIISEIVTPTTDVRIRSVNAIDRLVYRAHEGINQSFIKLVLEHGHNMATKLVADREDPTDDMIVGSVFHAILSGDEGSFLRVPKMDRRTKDGKAQYESFMSLAAESGKTTVQDHLWDKAEALVPAARKVVESAIDIGTLSALADQPNQDRELSLVGIADVFRDDKLLFSLPVKGQIDHLIGTDERYVLIDYKTAPSSAYEPVRRKARESNWPLQAYLYERLVKGQLGDMTGGLMYVVSGKDTGASRAYTFSEDSMQAGRASLIKGLIRIHNQRSNPNLPDDEYFGVSVLSND